MLITAHGGALRTGRNTPRFFQTIKDYKVDVIEVDIYKRNDTLYISHLPRLHYKQALSLSYVFEYLKVNDFKVNCDVKRKGLVKCVIELAKKFNVEQKLIFTGAVSVKDICDATFGDIYLNAGFFSPTRITASNLPAIKEKIVNLKSPNIKGLNLNYKSVNNAFLDKAKELEIPLSLYTVDDKERLFELMDRAEIANITTNIVDVALQYLNN